MSGLLRSIETETLETLHTDRGDVDRIGETDSLFRIRLTAETQRTLRRCFISLRARRLCGEISFLVMI
jgi:hypothetical protein